MNISTFLLFLLCCFVNYKWAKTRDELTELKEKNHDLIIKLLEHEIELEEDLF